MFDLDGTLLPMDQDIFLREYLKRLAASLAPHGYEPQKLINGILHGTYIMIGNNGKLTNEEAFWADFASIMGPDVRNDEPLFDKYYRSEFQLVKNVCGFTPRSKALIEKLKSAGYRRILATNPLFPAIATESRIRWAGMEPEDFELYTTYENSRYCKPNVEYYREILRTAGLEGKDCVMVGNDVDDDSPAAELGMEFFLLTDCLINKHGKDISAYPNGGFDELEKFLFSR